MRAKNILVVAALTASSAIAVAGVARAQGYLVRGTDLRSLIEDGALIISHNISRDGGGFSRIYLYSNGLFQKCQHGPAVNGTYKIQGNAICVKSMSWSHCYRLKRTSDRAYELVMGDGSDKKYTSIPVSIHKIDTDRSCNTQEK